MLNVRTARDGLVLGETLQGHGENLRPTGGWPQMEQAPRAFGGFKQRCLSSLCTGLAQAGSGEKRRDSMDSSVQLFTEYALQVRSPETAWQP
jgi:hypothetical protein